MWNAAVIQHLIFDMDGTLVDSSAICCSILSSMLSDRGSEHSIDAEYARQFMSHGGQQMVAALLGPACGDPDVELAEFRARYSKTPTPVSALFPDVAAGLRILHAHGFRLSICSNKPQHLCEQVLADTGLAALFCEVVGGQDQLQPKPAPDLLDEVLRRIGAAPEQCLFIGDSELDHETAVNGQIPFLFLTYGYAAKNWLPEGSGVFESFAALTGSILRSTQRTIAA